jgi:hypothetical protein
METCVGQDGGRADCLDLFIRIIHENELWLLGGQAILTNQSRMGLFSKGDEK